jgi:two-component system response regulator
METKPTLLLVEDNLDDAVLFKLALSKTFPKTGLEVANDVTQAIHYLESSGPYQEHHAFPFPYAIVVDLSLPGISGASFVQWIRSQPEFGKLLIVAWTGSREGKDIARLFRLGANSFLAKNASPEKLAKEIRELHEFWNKVGMLVNFIPQIDYSMKPVHTQKREFFVRSKDWPGFEPPKAGE